MLNFYPGPSKVYPIVKNFALEAFDNGILEKNHRSTDFMVLLKDCIALLKNHLNVPLDYKVYFTSSATESWEIVSQSFLREKGTHFLYNGAFGKKWASYSSNIKKQIKEFNYDVNDKIPLVKRGDLCFVANETSNGTQVNKERLKKIREYNSEGLIIIDAVSSLGGVDYNIKDADIWISSSQKCFGLPSGLGIMIVSPKALERAIEIDDKARYNSALFIDQNFELYQTHYTPNILGIYMLKRLLESLSNIEIVASKIKSRKNKLYTFFNQSEIFKPLVEKALYRSDTVLTIKYNRPETLVQYLNKDNIIIGKGYGEWKLNTFRIANFPAIPDQDYDYLIEKLRKFESKLNS